MSKKKPNFLPKHLSILLSLGLSVNAWSAISPQSPFSQIPLHLQNSSTVTTAAVKPNLALILDNSSSMLKTLDGKTKITHLLNTATWVLDKYGTKFNWVILPTTDPAGIPLSVNNQHYLKNKQSIVSYYLRELEKKLRGEPNKWRFGMNLSDMKQFVQNRAGTTASMNTRFTMRDGRPSNYMTVSGNSPLISRYLDALFILQQGMEYRCQKNYAVLFSDGVPTDNLMAGKYSYTDLTTGQKKEINSLASLIPNYGAYGQSPILEPYTHTYNDATLTWLAIRDNNWTAMKNDRNLATGNKKFPLGIYRYQHPDIEGYLNRAKQLQPSKTPIFGKYYCKDDLGCQYLIPPNAVTNANAVGIAQFLTESVKLGDLKTNARDGVDAAGKPWDDPVFYDEKIGGLHGRQTIETFAIGYADSPMSRSYLKAFSPSNDYKDIVAKNEADLRQQFDKIFSKISEDVQSSLPPQSFSSFAPALSHKDNSTKLPDMAAAVRLILENGASEIYFYKVNNKIISDDYTVPNYAGRKTLIHDGNRAQWVERFSGSNAFFDLNSSKPDEWRTAMLPWITRSTDDNIIANMGGLSMKYRNRNGESNGPRNMGDIIGSGIVAYGPLEFARKRYLVTAANDGMIYLFKSSSNANHPYDLKLNYIPAAMERQSSEDTLAKHFKYIANADYVTPRPARANASLVPHQYMVNGGFVIRTMDSTGPEQTLMALNMGQGGRGTVALNLGGPDRRDAGRMVGIDAPQSDWENTVPLFETPKGADNMMGYTIGKPTIGRIAMERSVSKDGKATLDTKLHDVRQSVFIGSGILNPSGGKTNTESALYVYNAIADLNVGIQNGSTPVSAVKSKAGDLVKKIAVPAELGKGGLAEPTIVDIDFDGAIDIVYAGDYGGNLYRFDLRGKPNEWTVKKIFQTAANQPITSAPAVLRDEKNRYVVIFGTGSDLYQEDLKDKSIQAVYGIYDDLTNFEPQVKQVSGLVQQTFTEVHNQQIGKQTFDLRTLTDNPIGDNPQGWYFNLTPSERVVVKPHMLLKTAIITTRSYKFTEKNVNNGSNGSKPDLCLAAESSVQSSGESWIMQVKADNGGNLPGKDGDDIYGFVDITRQNTGGSSRNTHTADLIPSGTKIVDGGLSGIELDATPTKANGLKNSTTVEGDASGSGQDPDLRPGGGEAAQRCLPDEDNFAALTNSGGSKGVENLFNLIGLKCSEVKGSGHIRRLSWREIF